MHGIIILKYSIMSHRSKSRSSEKQFEKGLLYKDPVGNLYEYVDTLGKAPRLPHFRGVQLKIGRPPGSTNKEDYHIGTLAGYLKNMTDFLTPTTISFKKSTKFSFKIGGARKRQTMRNKRKNRRTSRIRRKN